MATSVLRVFVFAKAATCLASATSCVESACEQSVNHEHVSTELDRINAGDVSVQLLQRHASEDIDEDVEDYEDEEFADDVETTEDDAEVDEDFDDEDAGEVDCIGGWVQGDSWSRDSYADPPFTDTKEECVEAVKRSCPEANGATWRANANRCYCEFDSCGVAHADGGWETALHCLIREVAVAEADAEGCIDGWKPGDASHMVKELRVDGGASSASECLAKVRDQHGDAANGATWNPPKSMCWGEVNQSSYVQTGGGYESAKNCWFGYWCGHSKKQQSGETPAAPAPAPAPEDEGPAPAPAPTGICKAKCEKQYSKYVKKGKEGLGFKRVCQKSFCADCSFCQGEFPTPAPTSPCRQSCQTKYAKFAKKGKESMGKKKMCSKRKCSGCDMCAEGAEAAPAPAPEQSPSFSIVEENRYWGCARKGMGNLHGFGHGTAEECFAATLKDPACKGQFDYNQRYNGQCKCVTAEGCTELVGLGGYNAYKIDDA